MGDRNIQKLLARRGDRSLRRGWRCPDETRLAAYADRRLGGSARQSAETHVADCDYCRAQVAFLVRAADAPADVEVPARLIARAQGLVAGKQVVSNGRGWRWAAAAAAACLILTAGLALALRFGRNEAPSAPEFIARNRVQEILPASPSPLAAQPHAPAATAAPAAPAVTPRPQPVRAPAPASRKPTANLLLPELVSPRDGAVLRRGELEFRWRPVGEAVFYEVSVMTAAGDLVVERQTSETRLSMPADVTLVPGAKYFVSVRAHLRQGKTSKSDPVRFRFVE